MDLGNCKPFSQLDSANLNNISDRITECTFSAGEDIINLGEEASDYYIIKSGSAVVLKKMLEDEMENVEVLGVDDGFGEDALINDTKQGMTVRAIENVIVWKISRSDFDQAFKPALLKEISPEDAEEKVGQEPVFLDVRMEFEYEEEHIPGALNIPLDELRIRCSELDQDRVYYCYCLVSCRSAAAAFILASMGFKTRNVKGGIMNWKGPLVKETENPQQSFASV